MAIEIRHLSKAYGDLSLYEEFSLRIEVGKITAITGASGGGKTTFLRMLAGLEPFSGEISGIPAYTGKEHRGIAYLFQEDCLLPWLTLEQNLDLVMRTFFTKEQRQQRLGEILDFLRLAEFRKFYPGQLSGGMQRRAALGRLLAYDGELLLLDEPFKGLDEELRLTLRKQLKQRWMQEKKTVIFVTHDLEEAGFLADSICCFCGRPVKTVLKP